VSAGGNRDRLRRLVESGLRCVMSLRGVIESRLRMYMARVVVAFAAVFSCGAMALDGVVVFLRSGVVGVNYMGAQMAF